ncbi:septal ring lytic transglycosylase RlpA family protein [Campylobacter sp. MG1]|uniref:septal ring lytic transglycosylase RlpA family protein n=1 Tax=Campylobacter sp. MG1 TaxID=2976332 RepID=UPI002D1E3E24|nr:septal ring lytic transglycosylase RlpA family protein [Campylobacter sp. MG1]
MKKVLFFLVFVFIFIACSSNSYNVVPNYGTPKSSTPATMRPYVINGKTYYPSAVNVGDSETGIASWYGPGFHGKKTSNGEVFDTNALTAAHKTLPMNTIVKVDNLENGKSIVVRINDRGPFVPGRIIDLSNRAAYAIDMTKKGTAKVKISVLGFNDSTQGMYTKSANIGGNFMIQIGAFKSMENAYNLAKKYESYNGYTSKVLNSSDGFYRVFLKGFRSEAEARDFTQLSNFLGSFIFRE